jgi:hypothetical protein
MEKALASRIPVLIFLRRELRRELPLNHWKTAFDEDHEEDHKEDHEEDLRELNLRWRWTFSGKVRCAPCGILKCVAFPMRQPITKPSTAAKNNQAN